MYLCPLGEYCFSFKVNFRVVNEIESHSSRHRVIERLWDVLGTSHGLLYHAFAVLRTSQNLETSYRQKTSKKHRKACHKISEDVSKTL